MRVLILSFLVFIVGALPALACSPVPFNGELTAENVIEKIVVKNPSFLGLVTVSKATKEDGKITYDMTVEKQYIGEPQEHIITYTSAGNSCGAFYQEGQSVYLYLLKDISKPQFVDEFSSSFSGVGEEEIKEYLDSQYADHEGAKL